MIDPDFYFIFIRPFKNLVVGVPRRVWQFLFLLGLISMVGCESERAKWNLANAMNLEAEGELEEAISLVEIAMEQAPDNDQIKLQLARMLSENGQGELGMAICDERLEQWPNCKKAHATRTMCLQFLGRFDESLADYKEKIAGHVSKSPLELNNLAYYRALAREDLGRAAKEIQEAIEIKQATFRGMRWKLPLRVRAVICAGLISRHIGQQEQALHYLDKYIERFEVGLSDLELQEKQIAIGQVAIGNPPSDTAVLAQVKRELVERSLALLIVTRALILEDLGDESCVDLDRRRLVELGFEFGQIANELPSDLACLASLETATIFLDTRGFVVGRMDWYESPELSNWHSGSKAVLAKTFGNYQAALEDLDIAILAARFQQEALESPLFNLREISPGRIQHQKSIARRMTAVLLFHRMEVHRRGENMRAAQIDEQEIEQLGFSPGPNLF